MSRIVLFNKPYGVLCQFSGEQPNLSGYVPLSGVYPAGRLDKDSEGLLLLTDDGALQHRISHPLHKRWKSYWVQVEGEPAQDRLEHLRAGVELKDGPTKPARARLIPPPQLWPRDPPVRFRKQVPDHWLQIEIQEGRNRQVRRMTAAVGLPTLRLVRLRVDRWQLGELGPGEYRVHNLPAAESAAEPIKNGPTKGGPRRNRTKARHKAR